MTASPSLSPAYSTLETSTVFYRDHRLTPLAADYGTFACRIDAPETGALLTILTGCPSAGQALIQGQYWVMQQLGIPVELPAPRWRVHRRCPRAQA